MAECTYLITGKKYSCLLSVKLHLLILHWFIYLFVTSFNYSIRVELEDYADLFWIFPFQIPLCSELYFTKSYLSITAEVSVQFAYKCISILLSISLFVIKISIRKIKPTRLRRVGRVIPMLQMKMCAEFLSQNLKERK